MSLVQKYEAYKNLITEIILFLALQSSLVIFLFIYDRKRQKEKYKQNIIEEKSKNLELYTQSLEKEQLKLRKFKHDYKNMIVSLRSFTSKIPELDETINKFDDYSSDYFKGQFLNQYKDLGNVENSYLKSLLISKFHAINLNETECTFECRDKIDNLTINIFDLIRLLGISIDNAIESTENQSNGKIGINIVKKNNQLLFLINNTSPSNGSVYKLMNEGYSTKQGHSGFGLSNIQEIKKKYPDNITSKYEKSDGWFKLELIIK
ncbi:GHKL domain-containing protein [Companilactobacillus jidongensis]|uniref:GHKL domain-containing protein n=1 Tax=Companilactobacillus jidongensis TaxID=2486006 RepID=UPI0013DD9EF4|nr:GHKL domain-containing protein [Companilactobacillus jidongensis]